MSKELPSFQIDVVETAGLPGQMMHRLAPDTARRCNDIITQGDLKELLFQNPAAGELNEARRFFYSKVALQLSDLSNQQLMDNFSQVRVCFRQSRSVKNYQFRF